MCLNQTPRRAFTGGAGLADFDRETAKGRKKPAEVLT